MKQLRVQVAETSRFLHQAGWCANHDGNVSARDGNRFVATPTATSKRLVQEKDLIEVDAKGQVHGAGKVFGEIGLHLAVYERRPDVGCVVHAHPPCATAISASRGNPIERPFIAEAFVSLGPARPGPPPFPHAAACARDVECKESVKATAGREIQAGQRSQSGR